jgi:hypothetical protein
VRLVFLLLGVGLLTAPAGARAICLGVEAENGPVAVVPAAVGDEVRLSFRHSIYGSPVEEHFRLSTQGLMPIRRRYAEQRLVEFYGYETARREDGWWVVEGEGRGLPTLTLRANPESIIEIAVGAERIPIWERAEPGGWVRLAVTACDRGDRARRTD